jgi:hypothetical protein
MRPFSPLLKKICESVPATYIYKLVNSEIVAGVAGMLAWVGAV